MADTSAPPRTIPDRAAYVAWVRSQPRGRFERVLGEVVTMSPERWEHARLKAEIWLALRTSLVGHPTCTVVPDGMTVQVDDATDFEPDVAVHCGEPIPSKSLTIPSPLIVIEVLSANTQSIDTVVKTPLYLKVAKHYLIFRSDRREVLHWRRGDPVPERPDRWLRLDPPGIALDVAAIYEQAGVD